MDKLKCLFPGNGGGADYCKAEDDGLCPGCGKFDDFHMNLVYVIATLEKHNEHRLTVIQERERENTLMQAVVDAARELIAIDCSTWRLMKALQAYDEAVKPDA